MNNNNDDAEEYFIQTPAKDTMRCGLLTNAKGDIVILHDQELPTSLEWIEYDPQRNKMTLVFEGGKSQDLGLAIEKKATKNLLQGQKITLSYIKDQKIVSNLDIPLIITGL